MTPLTRRRFLGHLSATLAASASLRGTGAGAEVPEAGSRAADVLRGHKLAAIEIRRAAQPWPRVVGKNARLDTHGRGPSPEVAILKTNQGASGWGMIRGSGASLRERQDRWIGKDIGTLIDPATGCHPDAVLLDFPLHDLAGVILNQPVWKLIGGGSQPKPTRIYSGMIYFDELEPANQARGIDTLLDECRWDRDHGYRQLKIKIGRGARWMPAADGLKRDIEVVRAIAKAFPDCELLVDANNGYDVDTAIRFLEGIGETRLFWFEEPFHETAADWHKLRAWMGANGFDATYRADGEYNPDTEALDLLGREGVVNLRLEDIVGLGFTRWRSFLPDLAARGIAASPHAWGEGVKTVYTGHLAAALDNIPTVEGVTFTEEEVLLGDNRIVDGGFVPSNAPGFGLTLREKP